MMRAKILHAVEGKNLKNPTPKTRLIFITQASSEVQIHYKSHIYIFIRDTDTDRESCSWKLIYSSKC